MPALPRPGGLPEDIADLVHYQKQDVAHERFGRDAAELITAIIGVRRTRVPRKPPMPHVPWGWIGATAASVLAIGWVGAHQRAYRSGGLSRGMPSLYWSHCSES